MVEASMEDSKLRNCLAPFIPNTPDTQMEAYLEYDHSHLKCLVSLFGSELHIHNVNNETSTHEKVAFKTTIKLFLPLYTADFLDKILSISNQDISYRLTPTEVQKLNPIDFEQFAEVVCKRSLNNESQALDPELRYSCVSVRFYTGYRTMKHLYCSLAACLISKTGPNRSCLPSLVKLQAHGMSSTLVYRLNLGLNKTPKITKSLKSGLGSIIKQMCEVISDLARVGLTIKDFDPAEDTIMDNNSFQLISLGKIQICSQDIQIDAYLEQIACSIKCWTGNFDDRDMTSELIHMIESLYDSLFQYYENAEKRQNFLFSFSSGQNAKQLGKKRVRNSSNDLVSDIFDSSIISQKSAVLERRVSIDDHAIACKYTYKSCEQASDDSIEEKNGLSPYSKQFTNDTLKSLEADLLQIDLSLLEDAGSVSSKVHRLNTYENSKKTLSVLSVKEFKA